MTKGPYCQGCAFEKQQDFLFPTKNDKAKLVILSEYPTETQCDEKDPWAGDSARHLERSLLPLSGVIERDEVQVDYVLRCRLPYGYETKKQNKGKLDDAVARCRNYLSVPDSAEVVVCHGELGTEHYAKVPDSKKLGTYLSADTMRGFLGTEHTQGKPTFIVKSTSTIMKERRMMIPTKADWRKLGQWRDGKWPRAIPHREIAYHGLTPIIEECFDYAMANAQWCVIDTEYDNKKDMIYPGILEMIGILFWDGNRISGVQFPWKAYQPWQKSAITERIKQIVQHVPTVMHNLMADVPVMERALGIKYEDYTRIDDTMLLHALLHCEWPHTLGFLESMYSPYDKMKHLSDSDPFLYNWGDCLSTHHAFVSLAAEAKRDVFAWDIYNQQSLPLSVPRIEAKERGVALDKAFLAKKFKDLSVPKEYARQVAVAWCGYEINPGSGDQVMAHLVHEGMKLKKSKGAKEYTIDEDALSTLRRQYLDFDPEEEKDGIEPTQLDAYLEAGGHGLLEAVHAYKLASKIKSSYLVPLIVPEHQKEAKTAIEVPEEWFIDRVHPDQFIHSQTSGRWSTVDPALPLIPPKLRAMLIPDPGWAHIKFDWDQIELRIGSALSNDKPSLEAFDNKWDIHTLNCCDIFGMEYPPDKRDPHKAEANAAWREKYGWEGKDDKRRVFAKGFVYRLRYRGDARFATDVPGAKAMGLDGKKLVNAARGYLRGHPALQPSWNKLDSQILQTRTVRSVRGRKRYLNGIGKAARAGMVPEICREGSNHPMQASVSDIFNETIIEIYQTGKPLYDLVWVYGAHDSQMWTVPNEHVEPAMKLIETVATQVREMFGHQVKLPIEFEKVKYAPMD